MKKILTIIGAISLISTPTISVVGCLKSHSEDIDHSDDHNDNGDNNDHKNVFDMGFLFEKPTHDEIKEQIFFQFSWKHSLKRENMVVDAVTGELNNNHESSDEDVVDGGAKVSAIDFNTNKVVTLELKWTLIRMIPTKYIDSVGRETQTYDIDLSQLNVTKITQIGYRYVRQSFLREDFGQIKIVTMPKTVEEVPSTLPRQITSLRGVFEGLIAEQVKGIEKWYVGSVQDMREMFKDASNFNQDLSNWHVVRAERMDEMFRNAQNFNQDLSSWDVARVKWWTDFATGSGIAHDKDKWPEKFR